MHHMHVLHKSLQCATALDPRKSLATTICTRVDLCRSVQMFQLSVLVLGAAAGEDGARPVAALDLAEPCAAAIVALVDEAPAARR